MNIREHLPSKPIQIILGVLLCIGLGYLGYSIFKSDGGSRSSRFVNVEYINEGNTLNNALLLDSDNDGLYDWKEIAWGLDPHDPYSNGNGILDGKYVEQKQLNELPRYGQIIPESNLSESEKLGRGLMTALLAINASGGNLEGATEEQVLRNLENQIASLTFGQKNYLREDFTRVASTEANAKKYRTAMTTLFTRYPIALSDIQVLVSASEQPEEYHASATMMSRKYKQYLDTLVTMPVPDLLVPRHTQLANSVSQLSAAFDNLVQEEVDEIVIFSSFVQLETIMSRAVDAVIAMNIFFDIIDEPGVFAGIEEYQNTTGIQ